MFALSISSINFSIEKWNGNERSSGRSWRGLRLRLFAPFSSEPENGASFAVQTSQRRQGVARLWRIFSSHQWAFAEKVSSSIMKSQISIQQIIAEQFSDIYNTTSIITIGPLKASESFLKTLLKVIIFLKVRKTSPHTHSSNYSN